MELCLDTIWKFPKEFSEFILCKQTERGVWQIRNDYDAVRQKKKMNFNPYLKNKVQVVGPST